MNGWVSGIKVAHFPVSAFTIKLSDFVKELEDHSWFPADLRNFQMDFIGFVVARLDVYREFVQHLKKFSLPQFMVDLCSGGGEPAISIFKKSNRFDRLVLSDKFPGTLGFRDNKISYLRQSADVLEMEFKPGTCYTMFNAFHHFTDDNKIKIAQKVQSSGSVAFFVEVLEPTVICFLKIFFATVIGTLFITPFIKPFSFKRLFFTYIIPINIFTIAFDGIVSVFKSRSVHQYQKLFNQCNTIEVLKLRNGFHPLIIIQIRQAN
jgi:ubiquinone/menaquinone biosynthesis C-methylase UbiE